MSENILILGGTREASELASRLVEYGHTVTTSFAGRTKSPAPVAGKTRLGGFGGKSGLAQFLELEKVTLLVDATHPFASRISENAKTACDEKTVPRLTLSRPAWTQSDGDRWTLVSNENEAADALPNNATCFLALGSQHLAAFEKRDEVHFILRMVDKPDTPIPFKQYELLTGTPSLSVNEEQMILSEHGVTHIVCRNSGGKGAFAKLVAARNLSLPVIMIDRPVLPTGETFASIDALLAAID